jgi:hypothetical protein
MIRNVMLIQILMRGFVIISVYINNADCITKQNSEIQSCISSSTNNIEVSKGADVPYSNEDEEKHVKDMCR